jgi:hypothetical protein
MHSPFTIKIVSIILLFSLILSACQAATPDPASVQSTMQAAVAQTLTAAPTNTPLPTATSTSTPTITPTVVPVVYGPTDFPDNVNPLTGLEVADPSILDRRPVMVKVANQMAARPHAGLSRSDIVFDYATGEGGDRFVALYYGQDDDKVGTVRSGRYVDIPLVQMYQGVLGMMSAYYVELDEILASLGGRVINTEHCDNNSKAICNDGPKSETSAFANTSEMSKLYESRDPEGNSRQDLDGMAFATNPPAGGETVTDFTVHYGDNNNHEWKYDESSKKFVQWIDEKESNGNTTMVLLVDRNNQEPIVYSNVVVVFAEIDVLNGATDTMHRYKFTNKNGRAIICRDGKMYDVFYKYTWNAPISFYDEDGNPFYLQPGNTWMHIVGLGSKVEQLPTGGWMVSLRMP